MLRRQSLHYPRVTSVVPWKPVRLFGPRASWNRRVLLASVLAIGAGDAIIHGIRPLNHEAKGYSTTRLMAHRLTLEPNR